VCQWRRLPLDKATYRAEEVITEREVQEARLERYCPDEPAIPPHKFAKVVRPIVKQLRGSDDQGYQFHPEYV
jgi:hypothetical protein